MLQQEKLWQVKEMVTQPAIYCIMLISKVIIRFKKQQALDADPKTIQKIDFTGNLDQTENTTMFFITHIFI